MVFSGKVALTVDLEEWSVPEDFGGRQVPETTKLQVSRDGLEKLLRILDSTRVKATFFVTAYFAQRNRDILREMNREGHEMGNHGMYHVLDRGQNQRAKEESIRQSTLAIEEAAGARPCGYREPHLAIKKTTIAALMDFDYLYDSSIMGTWLPRKLHWLSVPSAPFVWKADRGKDRSRLVELPISVWPKLRIPAGWWWCRKNLGESLLSAAATLLFRLRQPCVTNVHTWELAETPEGYNVPFHIRRNCGEVSAGQILRLISGLKRAGAQFVLMKDLALEDSGMQTVTL